MVRMRARDAAGPDRVVGGRFRGRHSGVKEMRRRDKGETHNSPNQIHQINLQRIPTSLRIIPLTHRLFLPLPPTTTTAGIVIILPRLRLGLRLIPP